MPGMTDGTTLWVLDGVEDGTRVVHEEETRRLRREAEGLRSSLH